jgi:hypothetical protein
MRSERFRYISGHFHQRFAGGFTDFVAVPVSEIRNYKRRCCYFVDWRFVFIGLLNENGFDAAERRGAEQEGRLAFNNGYSLPCPRYKNCLVLTANG